MPESPFAHGNTSCRLMKCGSKCLMHTAAAAYPYLLTYLVLLGLVQLLLTGN